jgi:hypothetical protein
MLDAALTLGGNLNRGFTASLVALAGPSYAAAQYGRTGHPH